MMIDFSVSNYKSIKDLQTLNMASASIVSKFKETDENNLINVSDKLSLLKSKAIYGANASGKSNFIRAIVAFISIVNKSVKDEKILDNRIEPFLLSTDTEKKPTYFQMSFLLNGTYYRYGFEATSSEIVSEWLFGSPNKKEVPFFTREGNKIDIKGSYFKQANKFISLYKQEENDVARRNSLFLTTAKSLNVDLAKDIVDYISSIIVITGLSDKWMQNVAISSLSDENTKERIIDLLKIADIGIDDLYRLELSKDDLDEDAPPELIEEISKGKRIARILTEHKRFNSKNKEVNPAIFSMNIHESEGSKKMFEISPFILNSLNEKRVLIMDEFDARFHPLLTKKIVELFNSKTNKESQFIFATHDTNLLNARLLRRDQISFSEKDRFGATHFYSLVDFKGVRNDASFEKDYISGKYGAIPFIGDLSAVIED